jgi:hypothetical protein
VPADVTDRDARLLGRAKILDSTGAVIDPATKGQLPAALSGGRLDVVLNQVGVVVPVSDNAGSLTVDAPVGTPVFVRLSDGAVALIGQKAMAGSVPVVIASDQSVIPINDNGGSLTVDSAQLPAALITGRLDVNLGSVGGTQTLAGVLAPVSEQRASSLHVTGTAAVNTGVTVTLPAPPIGSFHYITSIQVVKLYSVIGVAAGAGVIITSTNLPGGPAWTTEQLASPAGTAVKVIDYQPSTPLKAAAAATASTIVCPAQLQTIWRVNVSYFQAV